MRDIELVRDLGAIALTEPAQARESARQQIEGAIAASRQHRRPLRKVVFAAAAAAAILLFGFTLGPLSFGSEVATNAAASELQAAASRAEQQPTPGVVGDDDYAYSRSEVLSGYTFGASVNPSVVLVPKTREIWVANDGAGRIVEAPAGDVVWLTEPVPSLAEELESFSRRDDVFEPGIALASAVDRVGLSLEDMAELGNDASAFHGWVSAELKRSGWADGMKEYMLVADLLREAVLPPDFQAAVYRYAATIEAIELIGLVTDAHGRQGIGVVKEYDGVRYQLVFDRVTSTLLEETEVVSPDNHSGYPGPAGTVISRATYLQSGIVASTDDRP